MAQKIAFIMPVVIMWRRSRSSAVLKIQFRFLFKSGYLLSNPYPFYNKKNKNKENVLFLVFHLVTRKKNEILARFLFIFLFMIGKWINDFKIH